MKHVNFIQFLLAACIALAGCTSGGDSGPDGGTLSGNAPPFVYVANQGSNDVSVFQFNTGTGALTALAGSTGNPFPADTGPFAVTVNPALTFVYVANFTSNNISTYSLNSTTGVLTPLAAATGNPFPAGINPASVIVAPNGQFAYVANSGSNTVSAYSVDGNTGALLALGGGTGNPFPTETTPLSVTVTPNGQFLYVANSISNSVSAYSVNGATGALTPLAVATGNPFPSGLSPSDITVSPNGQFGYAVNTGDNTISTYRIDQVTGALTALPGATGNPFPTGAGPQSMTITPNGQFAYVPNFFSNNVSAYIVDSTTGVLTALAVATGNPFPAGNRPQAIAVSQDGLLLYVANGTSGDVTAYTINGTTGALTPLAAATGNPFLAGTQPHSIVIPGGR
jgi:6-phosphogluconolactonase (cycloisomerase 2 family)